MAKRYYWLKLPDGFFRQKAIKKLRKIAGGDTYTIIYLKMLLVPTVMTLKGVRLNAKGIITGVVAALAVGLPVFAYGSVLNSGPYKTLGSLLTVLLSGLIALAASGKERHYAR